MYTFIRTIRCVTVSRDPMASNTFPFLRLLAAVTDVVFVGVLFLLLLLHPDATYAIFLALRAIYLSIYLSVCLSVC